MSIFIDAYFCGITRYSAYQKTPYPFLTQCSSLRICIPGPCTCLPHNHNFTSGLQSDTIWHHSVPINIIYATGSCPDRDTTNWNPGKSPLERSSIAPNDVSIVGAISGQPRRKFHFILLLIIIISYVGHWDRIRSSWYFRLSIRFWEELFAFTRKMARDTYGQKAVLWYTEGDSLDQPGLTSDRKN